MTLALCASAILYGSAYVYPSFLWWAVVPAFFVLFYELIHKSVAFRDGFLWGCIAYGIHLFPLFLSLARVAQNNQLYGAWVVMTFYIALHAGLLFWVVGKLQSFFANSQCRIIAMFLVACFYIVWLDQAVLWVLGVFEGYQLFNPLVPLMMEPRLFFLLPYVGVGGMVVLFVITIMCGVLSVSKHSLHCFVLLLLSFSLWGLGFTMQDTQDKTPDWLQTIGFVTPVCKPNQPVNILDHVQDICSKIQNVKKENPGIKTIIMPESALPLYGAACVRACGMLGENSCNVQLIFGGYHTEGDYSYNSCYHMRRGTIEGRYNKTHGMPFVERMPRWLNCFLTRGWFLSSHDAFVQDYKKSVLFEFVPGVCMRPLLCSELFFTDIVYEKNGGDWFVGLINDAWFKGTAMPDLLWLLAQLKTRGADARLLYISYTRAHFII